MNLCLWWLAAADLCYLVSLSAITTASLLIELVDPEFSKEYETNSTLYMSGGLSTDFLLLLLLLWVFFFLFVCLFVCLFVFLFCVYLCFCFVYVFVSFLIVVCLLVCLFWGRGGGGVEGGRGFVTAVFEFSLENYKEKATRPPSWS